MATVLPAREYHFTRQEGDKADIQLVVPAAFSMTGRTAQFMVADKRGRVLINKLEGEGITIARQAVTIDFDEEDTKHKPGTHRWELETWIDSGGIKTDVRTIGYGNFVIDKEIIR